MINANDVAGLVGLGPEQKFCMIEQLARKRLAEAREQAENASGYSNKYTEPRFTEHDYAVDVSAAAIEFGIDELADFDMPCPTDEMAEKHCRMYRARATQVSQRLLYRYGAKSETVSLDGGTKAKISHWLQQMREAVQAADVTFEKKDRLFALIDELQAEVDRDRTPVHAAGELWLKICTYASEGAEKLEPVAALLSKVGGALGLSKQAEDSKPKSLPPASKPKQIEGPKGLVASNRKNGFDKALDDEIPF